MRFNPLSCHAAGGDRVTSVPVAHPELAVHPAYDEVYNKQQHDAPVYASGHQG
jgi:hypothetical protein